MRIALSLPSLAFAAFTGLALGCAVYVDPGESGSCEDICGQHASCKKGVCVCDSGYDGNPEADQGCQPTSPPPEAGACERGCGVNAYCSDGLCYCDVGSIAVCGTGDCLPLSQLCDDNVDCFNGADEAVEICSPTVVMDWSVIDSCADGYDIEWRLYAQDRDWVWPSAETVFYTGGLDVEVIEAIECSEGELICFGGDAGDRTWGVGIDGLDDCDDCCWECGTYVAEVPYLICN
ncbi:MAG: hypothetical protein H6711_06025 [Myxococcales bacterium]|nr:hypothetical protein [Myxococcales bacterium]